MDVADDGDAHGLWTPAAAARWRAWPRGRRRAVGSCDRSTILAVHRGSDGTSAPRRSIPARTRASVAASSARSRGFGTIAAAPCSSISSQTRALERMTGMFPRPRASASMSEPSPSGSSKSARIRSKGVGNARAPRASPSDAAVVMACPRTRRWCAARRAAAASSSTTRMRSVRPAAR